MEQTSGRGFPTRHPWRGYSSRSDLTKPTPATCARIANFLRPEFERVGRAGIDQLAERTWIHRALRARYTIAAVGSCPIPAASNDARGLGYLDTNLL